MTYEHILLNNGHFFIRHKPIIYLTPQWLQNFPLAFDYCIAFDRTAEKVIDLLQSGQS